MKLKVQLTFEIKLLVTLSSKFDNKKNKQNVINIQLDDMFTNGLQKFEPDNKPLRKTIVKFVTSKLLENKLIDNKEQSM